MADEVPTVLFLDPGEHPNAPRRWTLALAFLAIALAGVLGGLIGWGIVATSCSHARVPGHHAPTRSCAGPLLGATVVGTVIAAIGAGIVAVLVLRAQSEWRAHPPGARGATPAGAAGTPRRS